MPHPHGLLPLAAALLCAAAGPVDAGADPLTGHRPLAGHDPLAGYRGRSRVLVALAGSPADPDLARQRRLFDGFGAGGRDRDLVLVEATDGTPAGAALRRRFGGAGFRAVLVGKDGGGKLSADVPLGRDALFPLIDAMPMRRDEASRRDEAPRRR